MRIVLGLLTLAVFCGLDSAARAQDIVRPREFILLRPQEPPPAPMIMAPINIQPLHQQQWNWKNNNPRAITMQPLKPQPVIPQGNHWRSDQFQTWNFQSHNWNANERSPLGGSAGDRVHRQALGW
ncbi:MAG TPA: hypothetical protein VG433_10505 [Pirellulales bacterium]|jgi:hypothetical protein|nr:hypothetical protein [Pirellulales bacterium]